METMIKITNTTTALSVFEEAAIKHGTATVQGDFKTANKSYKNIVKAVSFLKEQNEILSLLHFLNHPATSIRLWSATYLLPVRENEAIKALEAISISSNTSSLDASMTLSEWQKGNLKTL